MNKLRSVHFERLPVCFLVAEFLVKFLEQEVCRMNWDVGFVTSTMQEIGVQLPRLLEVYDQLFKTRVQATNVWFQCLAVAHTRDKKLTLQSLRVKDQLVFRL